MTSAVGRQITAERAWSGGGEGGLYVQHHKQRKGEQNKLIYKRVPRPRVGCLEERGNYPALFLDCNGSEFPKQLKKSTVQRDTRGTLNLTKTLSLTSACNGFPITSCFCFSFDTHSQWNLAVGISL